MKIFITTLLLIASLPLQATVAPKSTTQPHKLTVSTFNLQWFGLGGALWGSPEQEFRQETLKRFIAQELKNSDVIVFTEAVDTQLLQKIVAPRRECVTYESELKTHQHTLICFNVKKYRLEKYDTDYIIEEVNLGSRGHRPATQAKLCHKKGKCFLQVLGVHLAAGRKTAKRLQQIELIRANFDRQEKLLPTIIMGDFNSYITSQTNLDEDDIVIFEKALSSEKNQFQAVTKGIFTFRSGDKARSYDHIVATQNIKIHSTKGYKACAKTINYNERFIPYQSFRRYFSDHCPVTAVISVS